MKENNTNQNKIPEFENENERIAHYQHLANGLADAMSEGVYPMDIVSYMWRTLETALDRNDIGFNHNGYTKAVIPYLLELNPEYEEMVVCMTDALKKLQQAKLEAKNAQD